MKENGSYRQYDFAEFPVEETEKTIAAMKKAEQENDIEALKWCAWRMEWLWEVSDISSGDDSFYPEHIFNKSWKDQLKIDPVPESIKDIIAKIDQINEPEPPNAAACGEALETIKAYFENNLGGKKYREISQTLCALQTAVKQTEDGK